MPIIDLSPVEPARIGFRIARGEKFREEFFFRKIDGSVADITGMNPQIIFRPKSKGGASGYDLEVTDPTIGYGFVDIDGVFFNDQNGYTCELYARTEDGRPTDLIAYGAVAMTGGAFAYEGPLGPTTLPTGPEGPQGPVGPIGQTGATGTRGSLWFNGTGDPTLVPPTVQALDQYLDVATGNVWQYDGATWLQVS